MDWMKLLTTLAALYGVILSTYVFIHQFKRDKFRLKINITMSILDPNHGWMVNITAANPGEKSVNVCGFGFLLPDGRKLVFPPQTYQVWGEFPGSISSGKSCQIFIPAAIVAEALASNGYTGTVKLVGYYHDQLDNTYHSRARKFEIEQWMRQREVA